MFHRLLSPVPDDPFYQPRRPLWIARELVETPALAGLRAGPREARYALLINPIYPKDPHASFGKHVLTPTLALTSVAAATPGSWRVRYWDENLLQGPPPVDPLPQVVGITVHLTFARRAYELAEWLYRWLYSPRSIWRRRPADVSAVLPYLAMSYLYKRSNRFWHLLIKHRLVHAAWKPLVHWTRWRHVRFRERLAAVGEGSEARLRMSGSVVSASV